MTYNVVLTNKFKKDYEKCLKRGLEIQELKTVIRLLSEGAILPQKYFDHPLKPSKDYKNCRELHIEPDWLLIYKYNNDNVILYLIRTGSHSDLFKK